MISQFRDAAVCRTRGLKCGSPATSTIAKVHKVHTMSVCTLTFVAQVALGDEGSRKPVFEHQLQGLLNFRD